PAPPRAAAPAAIGPAQSCDPISCILSVHPLSLNSRWPAVYPILTQWASPHHPNYTATFTQPASAEARTRTRTRRGAHWPAVLSNERGNVDAVVILRVCGRTVISVGKSPVSVRQSK